MLQFWRLDHFSSFPITNDGLKPPVRPATVLWRKATLFALNLCSFLLTPPDTILTPGISNNPAKKLPMMLPSTSTAFPCISATAYKMISMMLPNVALITAPTPILLCAEMLETAIPIK
ncbi:hypothetical protein BC937DRAFT_91205 [Endogone sp. FLAS-F59071]|nr:hypothetical protein BC937DRAFT_91205 [Endogone sp. FLAS-F59071]|eukprot:RUS21883.1 hypothetical protein BC937DRAFT_91205 [Endogone sp. FLAS-F59071]